MMNRKRSLCSAALLPACLLFLGVMETPAQPAQLIPRGAQWNYRDNGIYPGFGWNSRFYNDSAWKTGFAQFGYGEGDESTVVSYGSDPDTKYITTWFRYTFSVPNPAAFNVLNLGVLRDDGAVIYLNGAEIYRDNMPPGSINPATLASTNVAGIAEQTYFHATVSSASLNTGANVLAVELHQAAPDSIDLSFDLELAGDFAVTITRGPYLQLGTPTNIVVRWRTSAPTLSRVRYGTDPNVLDQTAEDPALVSEHALLLPKLQPDTKYFYSVETASSALAGGPSYFFVTSPIGAKPTRLWVLGDPGTANYDQQLVRDAYYGFTDSRHTDLWLLLGDNAYYSGTDQQYQEAIFDMYPEMLRKSVVWPTIGNHDTYSDLTMTDFPYLHIFTLPTQGEAGGVASGTKRYYSFDYGNIHFVCLDSMSSDRSVGSPMLQWLEQDLNANTNDWLVAFWHHPPYSKGSHDSDYEGELVEMRQNVVPMLENHGVDLVLSGHSHAYERSYLIDGHYGLSTSFAPGMKINAGDGRVDGDGPYRKTSSGPVRHQGAVYTVAGSSGQTSGGSLDHPAMFISLNLLGSMVLDFDGNTLNAQFLDYDGGVADHFTIQKGDNPAGIRITEADLQNEFATLTWSSTPGSYYIVQYTDHIEAPDWYDVSGPILATGATCSWSDYIPSNADTGFFRVWLMVE